MGVSPLEDLTFTFQRLRKTRALHLGRKIPNIPPSPLQFVDGRYKSVETGANFQRLKQATNKISFVLLSAILAESDIHERARVIKLMIMTAENCLTCENFDMFVSIISVLGSSAIHRLKQTWSKVQLPWTQASPLL